MGTPAWCAETNFPRVSNLPTLLSPNDTLVTGMRGGGLTSIFPPRKETHADFVKALKVWAAAWIMQV